MRMCVAFQNACFTTISNNIFCLIRLMRKVLGVFYLYNVSFLRLYEEKTTCFPFSACKASVWIRGLLPLFHRNWIQYSLFNLFYRLYWDDFMYHICKFLRYNLINLPYKKKTVLNFLIC